MPMVFLKLHFVASDRPGNVAARITLRDNGYTMVDNHVAITNSAAGLAGLEADIAQLQSELEEIRKQARRKFEAAKLAWSKRHHPN